MPTPIVLKVFRGNELLRSEQFNREIIKIGRHTSAAHLVLDDEKVSRIHSAIEVAPDGAISIIDMSSATGTFVNGKKVSRSPLRPGDQITVGGLRIVVEEAPAADALSPAVSVAPAPLPVAPAPRSPAAQPVNRAVSVPASAVARPAAGPRHGNGTNGHPRGAAVPTAAPAPSAAAPAAAPGPAPVAAPVPAAASPRAPRASRKLVRPRRAQLLPADLTVQDLTGAADLGVELRLLWGDTLLDAATFVRPSSPVQVGHSPRCALRVEGLPQGDFPMLRFTDGDYLFAFGQGMTGVVEERGARTAFGELVRTRKAAVDEKLPGAFWIPVPRAGAVRAELGAHLAVEARPRQPERAKVRPFWQRINYQFLNLFIVFFFLLAVFIVAANNSTYGTEGNGDELGKSAQQVRSILFKPTEVVPPKPADKTAKSDEKKLDQGEEAAKHKGEEGRMGKRDAPQTTGKSAPRAIDPNAKDIVKNSGLVSALSGRGGGGLSTVFGQGGLGGDVKGAIGNMNGPVVGDSFGFGGLGIRGTGTGGGGSGETIGIGSVNTKGRGGGLGGFGQGVVDMGKKRSTEVKVDANATVLGSIDRELIKKVIQEHASQIRYCYEQRLALNPRLQGKVSIKWVIQADGSAVNAQVEHGNTTLEDDSVHECMMGRIVSWQFPKPKGGGMAVITYPWVLRSSGAGE